VTIKLPSAVVWSRDRRVSDFDKRFTRARQALELAPAMTSEERQEYMALTALAQARLNR